MIDHEAFFKRPIDINDVMTLFHYCNNSMIASIASVLRISAYAGARQILQAETSTRENYLLARRKVMQGCAYINDGSLAIHTLREYYHYKKNGIQCDGGVTPLLSLDLRAPGPPLRENPPDRVLNNFVGLDRILDFYDVDVHDVVAIHANSIRSFHGMPGNLCGTNLSVGWTTELVEHNDVPHNVGCLKINGFQPATHQFIQDNFSALSSAGKINISLDLSRGIRIDEVSALLELADLVQIEIRTPIHRLDGSAGGWHVGDSAVLQLNNILNSGFYTGVFKAEGGPDTNYLVRDKVLKAYDDNGFRPIHHMSRIDRLNIVNELTRIGVIID